MVPQDEDPHVVDGVDVHPAAFEFGDKLGRIAHGPGHHHGRGALLEQPFGAQPVLILGHGGEGKVAAVRIAGVGMEKESVLGHARGLRFDGEESPAADFPAHVFQHVAVVAAVAAVQVGVQGRELQGVHGGDVVRGVGGHRGEHGHSPVGGLLDQCALVLRDAHAHAVDEHEVAAADFPEVVAVELAYLDELAVVGLGNLT